MSDADLAAEVAELRAIVDRTADWVTGLLGAARAAGYAEGLAETDDYAATARAQQARAEFRVIPGGRPEFIKQAADIARILHLGPDWCAGQAESQPENRETWERIAAELKARGAR